MAYTAPAYNEPLGSTTREDTWWLTPTLMAIAFIAFIIYAMWAALQPREYAAFHQYLSPFYSPDLSTYFPGWKWSPAFLIVWLPSGFRLTCYYGRKAYWRSIAMSPPACAVGKGKREYRGEKGIWIINNLHRYFLYLILVLVAFHWIHLIEAYSFEGKAGVWLGSLIISADTILLSLYVFSCHSLRHLIGGNLDCFSCAKGGETRHKLWKGVSALNEYHNVFFWLSLFTVGFADVYIRMCAMGIWSDLRIL